MMVIRDMLSRMEAEHKTKLEQLHVMQEQQRYLSLQPLYLLSVYMNASTYSQHFIVEHKRNWICVCRLNE